MNSKQKTVAILGNGVVGVAVAKGFAEQGYRVIFGTRDTAGAKTAEALAAVPGATAASFAGAAKAADLAFVALPWNGVQEGLELAGARNLAGKLVIDATNPIADAPPVNGVLKFYTTLDDSQMERLQREFAAAHFVKAFNSAGAAQMVNPKYATRPTMFICGNDAAAKTTVEGFLVAFGWETADMGGAEAARAIEPLCMLWCIPGFLGNEWTHAFKLLRRAVASD